MQKHPKQAFGIIEDGHKIKLAHIICENDLIYLQSVGMAELDRPIYHNSNEQNHLESDTENWNDKATNETIDVPDFEYESSDVLIKSFDTVCSSFPLRLGVVSINVNDENLIRSNEPITSQSAIKKWAKEIVGSVNYRKGNWQYSVVNVGERSEVWVHHGENLLLEMLEEYHRKMRSPVYFQLADANDIALTDYFKQMIVGVDKRMLLVYLGEEYRKAFVFSNGVWIDTLNLQIPQNNPDPEVICSKLSLALDSYSKSDPEVIIVSGDLIDNQGLTLMKNHFEGVEVDFIGFPQFIVSEDNTELNDRAFLSQYALPIALAYKSVNLEGNHFTKSNFLPSAIIEGQKVFKVAWHGFLVLGLIFITTLYFTINWLQGSNALRSNRIENKDLAKTLTQKRMEAQELLAVRKNLDQSQKNIEDIMTLLEDKNPWSFLLNELNHTLEQQSISWLNNLRVEKGTLMLTGTTTNRSSVIRIADLLPDSQIRKVTNTKIREYQLWQFEISSKLPSYDWKGIIEADLEELKAIKEAYGEKNSASVSSIEDTGINEIPASIQLTPPSALLKKQDDSVRAYNNFINTLSKNTPWKYREEGQRYLQKYGNSPLASYARWHFAYKLYLDRDYGYAQQFLEPLLIAGTPHRSYNLLLAARVFYAQKNPKYIEMYRILKSDYSTSPLAPVITSDIKSLGL